MKLFLLACCFLSGFSALTYETIWVRLFSYFYGHTTFAISLVLAAFMFGLSVGSMYFGHLTDKLLHLHQKEKILLLYVFLELCISFFGFLSPFIIPATQKLLINFGIFSLPRVLLLIIQTFVFFVILIFPTFFMGGTFPVLSRWFVENLDETGKEVSKLYGINTAGGVLGTFLTGFYLPTSIGVKETTFLAATLNLFIAVSVLFIYKKLVLKKETSSSVLNLNQTSGFISNNSSCVNTETCPQPYNVFTPYILLSIFFSGFAALTYEVAWTRAMALVLGSYIYSFAVMLSTFLIGLATGSILFGKLLEHKKKFNPDFLVLVELMIGISTLIFLLLFSFLPYFYMKNFYIITKSFSVLQLSNIVFCFVVMFIPTFFMGFVIPLASHLLAENTENVATSLGEIYSVDTLGAIAGSISAGFLFIPKFGIENTFKIGFTLNFISAFIVLIFIVNKIKKKFNFVYLIVFMFFLSFVWALPSWDKKIVTSGMFIYGDDFVGKVKSYKEFKKLIKDFSKIIFYDDGISSTISVHQDKDGDRWIRTNGKTDASSGKDMKAQLLLGYIPLCLNYQPHKVMVVGLGSGVTAGAIAQNKTIEQIDVVEIEPAMLKAASFFTLENHNVLDDSRVNFVFTDARNYFYSTKKKYDIVVSEPSNPWIAGVASLYTKEAFEQVKKILAEDGIFCQWFHGYSMSVENFKIIARTFYSVFPYSLLFQIDSGDYLFVGSNSKIVIDFEKIQNQLFENEIIKSDLKKLGFDHPFLLIGSTFILETQELKKYAGTGKINTDNLPLLEFSAPKSLYLSNESKIFYSLMEYKTKLLPSEIAKVDNIDKNQIPYLYTELGKVLFEDGQIIHAKYLFEKSLEYNPRYVEAIMNLGKLYLLNSMPLKAEEKFLEAKKIRNNLPQIYFYLGDVYTSQQMYSKAEDCYLQGLRYDPENVYAMLVLGKIYINQQKYDLAEKTFLSALKMKIKDETIKTGLLENLRQARQHIK